MNDHEIAAAAAIFAGRHGLELHEMVVQPRAATQAQRIGDFEQRPSLLLQQLLAERLAVVRPLASLP